MKYEFPEKTQAFHKLEKNLFYEIKLEQFWLRRLCWTPFHLYSYVYSNLPGMFPTSVICNKYLVSFS